MKYHFEKNTVQETLIIPLLGRLVCSEQFPALFSDPETQRQYDLRCEIEDYLKRTRRPPWSIRAAYWSSIPATSAAPDSCERPGSGRPASRT